MTTKTEQVINKLSKAGLSAQEGDFDVSNEVRFMIGLTDSRKAIEISIDESADVEVKTDSKLQQAIFIVTEPQRQLTRDYRVWSRAKDDMKQIRAAARKAFPISIPGMKFKKINIGLQPTSPYSGTKQDGYRSVSAVIEAPAQELYFLVGKDEDHYFICALPEKPTSVRNAHDILRPADVPKNSLRQGEFFLLPATQEELDKISNLSVSDFGTEWYLGKGDHVATIGVELEKTKELFVTGAIWDELARHKSLFLNGWHKVVHNREVQVPNMESDSWD